MKNRFPFLFLAVCAASLSLSSVPVSRADDDLETGGGDSPTEEEWVLMTSSTSSGTVSVNAASGTVSVNVAPAPDTTFKLVAPHRYASTAIFQGRISLTTATGLQIPPVIGPPVLEETPAFTGRVSKVKIRTGDKKEVLRVRAKVSLTNIAGKTLRGITATVYLSADNVLDSGDTKVVTLDFGDYFAKNKLGKGQTRKLHLDREVPAALASLLEGKYLIVDLKAANATGPGQDYPVVVGPIDLP